MQAGYRERLVRRGDDFVACCFQVALFFAVWDFSRMRNTIASGDHGGKTRWIQYLYLVLMYVYTTSCFCSLVASSFLLCCLALSLFLVVLVATLLPHCQMKSLRKSYVCRSCIIDKNLWANRKISLYPEFY